MWANESPVYYQCLHSHGRMYLKGCLPESLNKLRERRPALINRWCAFEQSNQISSGSVRAAHWPAGMSSEDPSCLTKRFKKQIKAAQFWGFFLTSKDDIKILCWPIKKISDMRRQVKRVLVRSTKTPSFQKVQQRKTSSCNSVAGVLSQSRFCSTSSLKRLQITPYAHLMRLWDRNTYTHTEVHTHCMIQVSYMWLYTSRMLKLQKHDFGLSNVLCRCVMIGEVLWCLMTFQKVVHCFKHLEVDRFGKP